MSGTYDEGLSGLCVEPLREDVLRAALPQIEENRLAVWRPRAKVAPALVAGEPSRRVEQAAVTLIELRHEEVAVTHVPFHDDTLPIR